MSANADVKISVKLADSASAGLLRSLGLIDAETGKVSAQAAKAGGALDAMGKKLGSGSGALKGTSRELDSMASKAKRVGDNLKSGLTTALSRAKEISSTLGRAGIATAGAGAAAYMGLKTQMPYDRALGRNAAIMYGTKAEDGHTYTKEEAKQQKQRLDTQITQAVAGGVMLRDDALLMQQGLLKSGKFTGDEGMARLDSLMGFLAKVSASTGTSGEDLANVVNAFVNKGFSDTQIKAAIGKGMVADNAGMYGMDGMAKYLPQWLANAGGALQGEHSADALFIHAQSVRKTAGTDDEAGNNFANYLSYAASDKADKALADLGINRDKAVKGYMDKGEDYSAAYAHVIDDAAKKDKGYQDLMRKVAGAKNDAERNALLEKAAYSEQGAVGNLITDVEARKAFFGINNDRGKNTELFNDAAREDGGIVETSHSQRFAGDATSSDVQMRNAAATGVNAALQELTPNIKAASDAFAAFASANPKTTGAGVIGVGAATVGSGLLLGLPKLLSVIFGDDKTEKVSKKSAKNKGAAVDVPETHASPANKGSKPSRVGRGVKVGGGLALASMVADPVLGMVAGEGSAVQRYGSAAISGAATGAFLGSLVPVVGTAVGAAAGGAIGMALEYFKPHPDAGVAQPMSNQMPSQPATQISAPQSEQLVIANAQLQQVNAQIAQLQQVANNEKLLTPLGQIQSGIAALNGKPWSFTASIPVYVDGNMVTRTVNKINGIQLGRG